MNPQDAVREMVRAEIAEQFSEKAQDANFAQFKAKINLKPELEKHGERGNGLMLARVMRALAGTKNRADELPAFFREVYKDTEGAEMVTKVLSNLTPGAGGYLVAEHWASELIPLLRAQAVVLKAGGRIYPMPNAIEHIPYVSAVTAASWIGDAGTIPVSQPAFGERKMIEKYLVGMTPISNNLIRSSTIEADAYIREDITRSLALKLDSAALLGDGQNGVPTGVWNTTGVTKLTVAARPDQTTPVRFRKALLRANVDPAKAAWIMHPDVEAEFLSLLTSTGQFIYRDEMMGEKRLFGFPYFVTTQLPVTTANNVNSTYLFLGDFNELLFGDRAGAGLTVDSSQEAAFVDSDNAVKSAYQMNLTLIRARHTTDIMVRQPVAFVCANDVQVAG